MVTRCGATRQGRRAGRAREVWRGEGQQRCNTARHTRLRAFSDFAAYLGRGVLRTATVCQRFPGFLFIGLLSCFLPVWASTRWMGGTADAGAVEGVGTTSRAVKLRFEIRFMSHSRPPQPFIHDHHRHANWCATNSLAQATPSLPCHNPSLCTTSRLSRFPSPPPLCLLPSSCVMVHLHRHT